MIDGNLIMLVVIGCLIISGIMYLVAGFKEGILWGICLIFLAPFSTLLFTVLHWDRARTAFIIWMIGITFLLIFAGLNPEAVEKDIQADKQIVEPIEKELEEESIVTEEMDEDDSEDEFEQTSDSDAELEAILRRRAEEDRQRQQAEAELEKERHKRMQGSVENFGDRSKSVDWYR